MAQKKREAQFQRQKQYKVEHPAPAEEPRTPEPLTKKQFMADHLFSSDAGGYYSNTAEGAWAEYRSDFPTREEPEVEKGERFKYVLTDLEMKCEFHESKGHTTKAAYYHEAITVLRSYSRDQRIIVSLEERLEVATDTLNRLEDITNSYQREIIEMALARISQIEQEGKTNG